SEQSDPRHCPPLRFWALAVGLHWTQRPGSVPQIQSDYSHYFLTRADGRVGGLLRCIHPSCCPRERPPDRSATTHILCTDPNRMRPWETPLERERTPKTPQVPVAISRAATQKPSHATDRLARGPGPRAPSG